VHNDGNRNVNCGGSWIHAIPPGVSGRTVRGLCFGIGTGLGHVVVVAF
jgi:hypothetical protein